MATTPVPAAEQGEQRISGFGRIIGALFSPKETFADIARKPGWLLPTIVLTITGLGLSATLARRADWVEVTRQQIEKVPFAARQMDRLTPEQKTQAIEQGAQRAKVQRYVRGCVGSFFLVFFMGLIYWGAFNAIGGAGLKYMTAVSVVAHAYLPLGVRELLGIPITLMKDPSAIEPDNFVASNIAAFLPSSAPLWQMALGSIIDVFTIWCWVLLAVGFAATNPKKLSLGKSFGIVGIVVGIVVAFAVGMAFIFS